MKNSKKIDPYLKKKLNQNEEKMQILYGIGYQNSKSNRALSSSTDRNRNKKRQRKNNDDYLTEMNNNTYKKNNRTQTPKTKKSKMSKTINKEKGNPSHSVSSLKKRMKFKNDKEEKKNNTIFYTNFSGYKKFDKNRKTFNKEKVNEVVDRLYNNEYKHRKNRNKESVERKNKSINYEDEADIDEMIERFEDDIKKREENLEIIKRQLRKDEKKIYTYKPKMSEGSKKYNDTNEEDFFERQKNFYEKKAKKEEELRKVLKKKQEDEINENNILKKKEEEKKKDPEKNKAEVEKSIKSLYDWEEQRKKKIEQKKKEKTEKVENDYNYRPKINGKSIKLAESNQLRQKQPNIFLRLSEEDKLLKGKKQILEDMYTPSFKPMSYVPPNMNLDYLKKRNYISDNQILEEDEEKDNRKHRKRKKKHKKSDESDEENEDDEEDEEDEEGEEEEDDEEEEEEQDEEGEFDYKQDTMKFAEDEVQDALRDQIFHKKKKKKRKKNKKSNE